MNKFVLVFWLTTILTLSGCVEVPNENRPCTTQQMVSDQITRIIGARNGTVYAGGC